jgi:hypothetical protein
MSSAYSKAQKLFDFLMHGMGIAMGTELFQFQTVCRVPAIFGGRVPRNPRGSLIGIGTTFRTL